MNVPQYAPPSSPPSSHPESLQYVYVLRITAACLMIFILWIGREILIPATIAALISFVISPTITRLRKFGIPNAIVASAIALILGALIVGLLLLASSQLLDLTRKVPEYRENLINRIRSIKTHAGSSLTNLHSTVDTLSHEMRSTTKPSADVAPVQVQVIPANDWLSRGPDIILLTLSPLATLGINILLVFFITIWGLTITSQ